jgi:exodeoxyribonuclease VII large subunit
MEKNQQEEDEKIFEPGELNYVLLDKTMKLVEDEYSFPIQIMGDLIHYKKWKRSGCSFKITLDNESIECKTWDRSGIKPNQVEQYLNTQCIVKGMLEADYFCGHRFVLNVSSIRMVSNDTKLKELKSQCQQKGYFENKKMIDWKNIQKIGIISKKNTQGYDDFCNQFKVPLHIILEEITLEGPKTFTDCIKSIQNLQKCDLIVIVRGGGDTSEISNSFDHLELFDAIQKSKVPVVTAIGHEQDKGDKLLITTVSDSDFATPTTLAKVLNQTLYEPVLDKINSLFNSNQDLFSTTFETEIKKLYKGLECFLFAFLKDKFGGTIVSVDEKDTHVIIEKNNVYYRNELKFDSKLEFTSQDIDLKNRLLEAFEYQNIENISKYYNKLKTKEDELCVNILEQIKTIKNMEKLKVKFEETTANKNKTYYLKKFSKKLTLQNAIKMKEVLLWYKEKIEKSMNGVDVENVNEIYTFFEKKNDL